MSKRKPTALKILQGNPGKRALPKNEPVAEVCAPRAPAHLSPEAKQHWPKVVKHLAAAKIMTRLDVDALAMYCESYAKWILAHEHLSTEGMITISPNGYPVQSAWLQIANKSFEQMAKMLGEFGMTPSSRAGVQKVPDDHGGGKDPWQSI